jgi:hypothetical protein
MHGEPQMGKMLERHEKIFRHARFIQWQINKSPHPSKNPNPGILYQRELKMTKHPSKENVKFSTLISDYGAYSFRNALR